MTLLNACRTLAVLGFLMFVMPVPAQAQLLSERVSDTSRECTYVGSETLADGQTVPRTLMVQLGQECPAFAPSRDPNAPVPPNAALLGERTSSTGRICLYSEAGIEYQIAVGIALQCAMTPALLEREREEAADR